MKATRLFALGTGLLGLLTLMPALTTSADPGQVLSDDFNDGDFTNNPTWTPHTPQGCAGGPPLLEVSNQELHSAQ